MRTKEAVSSCSARLARAGTRRKARPPSACTWGSVVMIPANVKHWHGAKKDSWFSHIAVEVPGENCENEWCEPVSHEEYARL